MPLIEITLSDPVPDVNCLACGKLHKYDGFSDWEECLILKDSRFIPAAIWGAWCNEECFKNWFKAKGIESLFD